MKERITVRTDPRELVLALRGALHAAGNILRRNGEQVIRLELARDGKILRVVATDGRRLHIASVPIDPVGTGWIVTKGDVLVSAEIPYLEAKAACKYSPSRGGSPAGVGFYPEGDKLDLQTYRYAKTLDLVQGQRGIPESYTTAIPRLDFEKYIRITVDREVLIRACYNMDGPNRGERHPFMRVRAVAGVERLSLSIERSGLAASANLDILNGPLGESIELGINPGYVREAAQAVTWKQLEYLVTHRVKVDLFMCTGKLASERPMVVKPVNGASQEIIMPVRL